jgi:hypothetical protein
MIWAREQVVVQAVHDRHENPLFLADVLENTTTITRPTARPRRASTFLMRGERLALN